LKNIQEPILNKGNKASSWSQEKNDFYLQKYVFGLVLVELAANILNAQ